MSERNLFEGLPFNSVAEAEHMLAELGRAFFQTGGPTAIEVRLPAAPRDAPRALVAVDDNRVVVSLDAAALALFGDAVGRNLEALFDLAALEAGHFECTARPRQGPAFQCSLDVSRLELGGGAIWLLSVGDPQQASLLEQARLAEARFRGLVEQMPAVTFMASLDEGLTEVYVSPHIEALLGFTQQEWVSNPVIWYYQLHPDDRELWNREFTRGCQTGGPFRADCRFLAKDGHIVWVHGEARIVRRQGRPAFLQGIAFDITDAKAAEELLRDARDVAEAANAELQDMSRAKSQFLANISHELRTPLNGIIGMTHVLLASPLSEDARDCVQTVRRSGDLLLNIINDVLDLTKSEAGKMTLEEIPLMLSDVVDDVTGLLREEAAHKGLELFSLIYQDVPKSIRGDPTRLKQILSNLLSNAIKFTPRGEILLRVKKVGTEGARVRLRFEVHDTGIGMSEAQRGVIFQPFKQADSSMTRRYGGTGLGLAISKQLVELMGGEIGVDSEPGQGSQFWFTMLAVPDEPAAAPTATVGWHRHIIVIDDDDVHLEVTQHQLQAWGLVVEVAHGALDALRMMKEAARRNEPYEVALVDMMMPDMDGMELASVIKADGALSKTRLLMVTGLRGLADEAMQSQRFDAVLNKPLRNSQLYNALASIFDVTPATDPEAAGGETTAHVLLVEDNQVNQDVACRLLQTLHCHVDVAANGREALEALSRRSYDIVFMDCQMPEMDGYEATARLRELERGNGQHLPVVAMTAHAMSGDRDKCLQAGMDDYLTKPLKPADFQNALRRWVKSPTRDVTPSVLDTESIETLRQLGATDRTFLERVREKFEKSAFAAVHNMGTMLASGDAAGVRREAHTLCGSSANVGAASMAAICRDIENFAVRGELEPIAELLPRLDEAFSATRTEMAGALSL